MTDATLLALGLLAAGLVALLAIAGIRRSRAKSAAIVTANHRFRATFEQAAVGLAHFDPQGEWLRVNDRFCAIVGYERGELLRKTIDEITHPLEIGRAHV